MKVEPTPSQTVGPFFGFALPFEAGAETLDVGAPGALRIEGRLLDGAGDPVPDGLLEVWQGGQFARCRTDAEGAFHFSVRKPPPPAPGLDGRPQAPHLNVTIFTRGLLKHLITRMYFPNESANDDDPVLARVPKERRMTLIAAPIEGRSGSLRWDVVLQGKNETVFFDY